MVTKNNVTLKLYPNPAKDELNIITKETIKSIEIISYLGQKIETEMINSKVDTHMLSEGYYVLRILTGNGIINKTFIKAK